MKRALSLICVLAALCFVSPVWADDASATSGSVSSLDFRGGGYGEAQAAAYGNFVQSTTMNFMPSTRNIVLDTPEGVPYPMSPLLSPMVVTEGQKPPRNFVSGSQLVLGKKTYTQKDLAKGTAGFDKSWSLFGNNEKTRVKLIQTKADADLPKQAPTAVEIIYAMNGSKPKLETQNQLGYGINWSEGKLCTSEQLELELANLAYSLKASKVYIIGEGWEYESWAKGFGLGIGGVTASISGGDTINHGHAGTGFNTSWAGKHSFPFMHVIFIA